ncbi:hypothetical protein BJ875DRAFT_474208 [Amylocarpus encephaloides]|uniref:Small ribosomal subunit protein uS11m n=1 Tax=Amylocarpus encephaloides TaxID=45428 RepID=A0A9P7YAU2_9HELO|nr:hypothetical protein BJ875DRAFT_474208 [Amylocarpus encephaloides]
MSRTISRRLLAQSPLSLPSPSMPTCRQPGKCTRLFSHSTSTQAEKHDRTSEAPQARSPSLNPKAGNRTKGGMSDLSSIFGDMINANQTNRDKRPSIFPGLDGMGYNGAHAGLLAANEPIPEPHHFHVYATRHNTHITVTTPKRDPLISLSCGNLGFKHSARKHYDSAFQLASRVMEQMQERGINSQIRELEVVMRGFGQGREAVTKALLGLEGKNLRHKIIRVADATRLKFGGTRSKKPRRLG